MLDYKLAMDIILLIVCYEYVLAVIVFLEKSSSFLADVDFYGPVDGRCYKLTHLDFYGDLFLSVGLEFDTKAISGFYTRLMRDDVLADWPK